MDPYRPQLTKEDLVSAIPGLNANLMQNWFVRGVIQLKDLNPGRGKKRLYSFHEALQVKLVHVMTQLNEPTKTAGPLAKEAADYLCNWMLASKALWWGGAAVNSYREILVFESRKDQIIGSEIIRKSEFDLDDYSSLREAPFIKILDFFVIGWQLYNDLPLDPKTRMKESGQVEIGLDGWPVDQKDER